MDRKWNPKSVREKKCRINKKKCQKSERIMNEEPRKKKPNYMSAKRKCLKNRKT